MLDIAHGNWHGLERASLAIGNPPDPKKDEIPKTFTERMIEGNERAANTSGTSDPMQVKRPDDGLQRAEMQTAAWGTIETKSGLPSPVEGGLACKFGDCATGADLSGDPARQKQLDTDLEQKRPAPTPLGMSNTA